MMRLLLSLAFVLALSLPAHAQSRAAHFTIGYDVAVEQPTFTYCIMGGVRGDPWGEPNKVNIAIDTVGSSTSVAAVTPATNPFANVAVGDAIYVRRDNSVTQMVWVTVRTDADNITVSSSVDWSDGFVFEYLDLVCGTGSADGWISVAKYSTLSLTVLYEIGDVTGLDVVWECKDATLVSEPVQVYPGPGSDCGFGTLNTSVCTYANTGDRQAIVITDNTFSFCRMGLAWRTADGGTREAVHATIVGR